MINKVYSGEVEELVAELEHFKQASIIVDLTNYAKNLPDEIVFCLKEVSYNSLGEEIYQSISEMNYAKYLVDFGDVRIYQVDEESINLFIKKAKQKNLKLFFKLSCNEI